jgi:hypothetical protein
MATCGRRDRAREFFHTAEEDFANSGVRLPPTYDAKVRLLEGFSAKTMNGEKAVQDWIDTFALWPRKSTPHTRRRGGRRLSEWTVPGDC